jgi:hypothetical protein
MSFALNLVFVNGTEVYQSVQIMNNTNNDSFCQDPTRGGTDLKYSLTYNKHMSYTSHITGGLYVDNRTSRSLLHRQTDCGIY